MAMKWSTAISEIQEKIAAFQQYAEKHDVFDDLQGLNAEYTPAFMRRQAADTLALLERMTGALDDNNDPENIPSADESHR
jgi:hypothetical protein